MATDTLAQAARDEVPGGLVTTVQLPAGAAGRRRFLQALQTSLGAQLTLGSLPLVLGDDVFVVPRALEEPLRRAPSLASDAHWEARLRSWGAVSVNVITSSALFALVRRGHVMQGPVSAGPAKVSLTGSGQQPAALPAAATSTLPGAFRGPFDWHLDSGGANVVAAWEMFSSNPLFQGALPWAGIRVGHVDTGYTEHAALGWSQGTSSTVDVARGHDFFDGDADPRDALLPGHPGHGTRTSASISGFLVNPAIQPYYGSAPGAGIVPYRVTDSVMIDHVTANVARAIERAVDDGCLVINICLGALFHRSALARALDRAYEQGVITVCAAGNLWGEVIYPGRYNRCITMGGIGPGMQPWAGSARGQYVDLCAPADRIRRVKVEALPPGTAATQIEPRPDGDGTSYATALTSGIAALWLAWHGADHLRAHYQTHGLWQIPTAFKALLRQSAVVPSGWDVANCGSGVVNAAALLALPLPADGALLQALPAADVFDPHD